MTIKDILKNTKKAATKIILGATIATSGVAAEATPADDILALSSQGFKDAIEATSDHDELKKLYKFAAVDKETARKVYNDISQHFIELDKTEKHQGMKQNWDNLSIEEQNQYKQEIATKILGNTPTSRLKHMTKEEAPNEAGSYNIKTKIINITSGNNFKDTMMAMSHEISHKKTLEGLISGYEGTVQEELEDHITENDCAKSYGIDDYSDSEQTTIYNGQPMENISIPLGRQIAKNPTQMPKEFTGPDIATPIPDGSTEMSIQKKIQQHPELLKAFNNDGKLERSEISHLLPTKNNTSGKLFLGSDKVATEILNNGNNKSINLSNSEIVGSYIVEQDLSGSNVENLKLDSTTILHCDMTNVDLSKIESIKNSIIMYSKITDTPENRTFQEQHSDSIASNEWILPKNNKSKIDISKSNRTATATEKNEELKKITQADPISATTKAWSKKQTQDNAKASTPTTSKVKSANQPNKPKSPTA